MLKLILVMLPLTFGYVSHLPATTDATPSEITMAGDRNYHGPGTHHSVEDLRAERRLGGVNGVNGIGTGTVVTPVTPVTTTPVVYPTTTQTISQPVLAPVNPSH